MMINFRRNIRLFTLFSGYSLRTTFQARFGIILFMLGKIMRFIFFCFLIVLIFTKTSLVKGYNLNQALVFYFTFNIVDTAAQVLFREVYRFRYQVVSGSFDLVLLKPHHPFLRILVGGVDFLDLILLFPYIGLAVFFAFQTSQITFLSFAFYLFLLINSFLIATAFHIVILALAILTTEVDHTILIYRDMTLLGRFPLDIYKEPIRGIFTFIIPIGIMMSFPPKALFHTLSLPLGIFSILVSSVLLFLSLSLWNFALKKYQSWGG